MKSIKKASLFKSRILSFAICIALICCTVLSFGIIAPRGAYADDGPDISQKSENGIRFVQVAAGVDFAIGLTYDGDLYGWSLKADSDRNTSTPATLGDYYPTDPKKIDVKFRVGPGGSKSLDWDSNSPGADYHEETSDRIAHIAATAYTAAFVTQKGYIYTWGRDDTTLTRDVAFTSNNKLHYLLLRSTETDTSVKTPWTEPYIIDYHYYSGSGNNDVTADTNMVPSGNAIVDTAIAAGEYNYIFLFKYNYQGSRKSTGTGEYYASFVWGSLLYEVPNARVAEDSERTYTQSYLSYNGEALNIYLTPYKIDKEQKMSVVAGGYTVGINGYSANGVAGATSLQLRGKNFLTTQNLDVDGSDYKVKNTTNVVTPAKTTIDPVTHRLPATSDPPLADGPAVGAIVASGITVNNAIAGAKGHNQNEGEGGLEIESSAVGTIRGLDVERYYARQATYTGGPSLYSTDVAPAIWSSSSDADGDRLVGDSTLNDDHTNNLCLLPLHYEVSLGNDIGYGISGGKLYAWGDNKYNQLTLGSTVEYKSEPTQILGNRGTIVSVAAGKQESQVKAFYENNPTLVRDDETGTYGFDAGVRNKNEYISAALTSTGLLWAWNKDIDQTQITFCDVDSSTASTAKRDEFAAIYSGYGNTLFAVTTHGKLVRITADGTAFTQKVYDKFLDETGKEIVNWVVDDGNDVVFKATKPTLADPDPEFGTATFYTWSATALKTDSEDENIRINGSTAAAYKPLIQKNNIGDAYRIVGYDAADAKLKFNLTADTLSDETYLPVFKFDGNLMTKTQQENMFEYDVVYDAERGVGVSIHPLQSTKGKKITIEINIARFNTYTKYEGTTDNAIYYDYKVCKITFMVEDTETVKVYSSYDSKNSNNCTIPLLDPNNQYNRSFSLAVQDVTTGVDELNKFLTSDAEIPTVNTALKGSILTQMKDNDKGFPDSDKVAKGNLKYYLNEIDVGRYNNTYKYLFTDRDSDYIQISLPIGGAIISGNAGVTGEIAHITVKTEITLKESLRRLAKDQTAAELAKISKAISTDFDNKYGLYNITYSVEENKGYISFTYDVLTFTATGSSGTIEYDEETNAVNSYKTTESSGAVKEANITVNTIVNYNYSATMGYVADPDPDKYLETNGDSIATVFSNASLRLKPDYVSTTDLIDINGISDDNPLFNGTSDVRAGRNSFETIITSTIFVGETREILLSSLFTGLGANMSFSYNNSTAQKDLNEFGSQWSDDTGHNMDVIKLSGDRITIHPTTAVQLNFTVEVQRFADAAKTIPFVSGKDDKGNPIIEEKIYITFRYTGIEGFSLSDAGNVAADGYLVTGTVKFDIFGDSPAFNAGTPLVRLRDARGGTLSTDVFNVLKLATRIYNPSTSEETKKNEKDKLFRMTYDDKSVTITPLRSGVGYVQFTVNVYNQSVDISLTINVSKETTLNNDHLVTVIEDRYVTISSLLTELEKSNSFNPDVKADKYRPIYTDIKNPTASASERIYNGIYFTDEKDNIGTPSFIKNAVFENVNSDNPDIRIISSNTSTQLSQTYYMHVLFTSDSEAKTYEGAKAGSIIDMIVPVISGKIKLQDLTDGGDLIAKIDCRHTPSASNWWTTEGSGLDTRVTIDLSTLLESAQIENPDKYLIFLLSADSAASSSFTYSKIDGGKKILIMVSDNTPLLKDNTRKIYELNVHIYRSDEQADTKVLSFDVSVDGIVDRLPVMTDDGLIGYGNIWLYSFLIVFGVLFIIFLIRFIVFIRRRAKQRAIIKRNQELIRMRDRLHGKANAASREQLVRAKMKMEDPKYAKMFNDMRRDKEDESGISLDNSDLAQSAEAKTKKKKKKKGGKKSVAELKAELEAKKAAFAAAQAQNAQPVNPFVSEVPIEGGDFGAPDYGGFAGDAGFADGDAGFADGGFGGDTGFADAEPIVFDATEFGDGNM